MSELPLDLRRIADSNKWQMLDLSDRDNLVFAQHLDATKQYMTCDAVSCIYKHQIFIFYKPQVNLGRLRFTIAHEFGHITLMHLDKLKTAQYEREANMFAARILMPACVLLECRTYTPEQISKLCGTSLEAATYRAQRLTLLRDRGKFYILNLEKKLVKAFGNFIKENKSK